jgi:hypothetical protein
MPDASLAVSGPQIFTVRGHHVVLDSDLARLYGVTTGNFNKAVKRNHERFPDDFSFVLTNEELDNLMFQIGRSRSHGGRRKPPRVFTEHGAIMAASVLNSTQAVGMSVYVVRAFIRMREELFTRTGMEKRLAEIEKTLVGHDAELKELYRMLRPLLLPPPAPPRRRIGYKGREDGHS